MDAICVSLSSFREAKGRTCHDWTPADCKPWATGGISLCLYCTMPMLCLRASQLYKLKQTFSFIDSIGLIFLNLSLSACVYMCVLCFAKPPLTTANKHSCRGMESFETEFLANPNQRPRWNPMMLFTTHDLMPLILMMLMTLICGFLSYLYSQVYVALIKYWASNYPMMRPVTYLSLCKTSW